MLVFFLVSPGLELIDSESVIQQSRVQDRIDDPSAHRRGACFHQVLSFETLNVRVHSDIRTKRLVLHRQQKGFYRQEPRSKLLPNRKTIIVTNNSSCSIKMTLLVLLTMVPQQQSFSCLLLVASNVFISLP